MRLLLAILTSSIVLSAPAFACGLCFSIGSNPLALPHPRTIELAFATRNAIDRGILKESPCALRVRSNVENGWNKRDKPTGVSFLKSLVERASGRPPETTGEPMCLHVVFVDSEVACTIHLRAGQLVLVPGTSGHADAVVATTSVALQAIVSGEITWGRAMELGLLHVEGKACCARVLSTTDPK